MPEPTTQPGRPSRSNASCDRDLVTGSTRADLALFVVIAVLIAVGSLRLGVHATAPIGAVRSESPEATDTIHGAR